MACFIFRNPPQKIHFHAHLCAALLSVVLGCMPQPVAAQNDNSEPALVLLVGYAPGGLLDRLARVVAQSLKQALEQPVVIRNIVGAGGTRAAQFAMDAKTSVPTLLIADSSLLVSNLAKPDLTPDLAVYPAIGSLGYTPLVIAVSTRSPWHTLTELTTALRQQPGRYDFGTPGVRTIHQLTVDVWLQRAGLMAEHVPYQGGSQMLIDLIEHRIAFGVLSLSLAQDHAKAQHLRLLAVTSYGRLRQFPEVPTLTETVPGVQSVSTAYLMASPQMPPAILRRLRAAWQQVMGDPVLRQEIERLGMTPDMLDALGTQRKIEQEKRQWSRVVVKDVFLDP